MKIYGLACISDYLDDFIVYRNLRPADKRLPALDDLRGKLSLPPGGIPRKNETEYACAVVEILKHARQLTAPGADIRRIIFLGDTRLLDSTAFSNICQAGQWPGIGFIGSETSDPAKGEIEIMKGGQTLYLSNRWSALDEDFREFVASQNHPIDEHTALLIDMDKTALGARGRNAAVIDGARVAAVKETVAELLGDLFDENSFRTNYELLVQPEFHPFTGDNQDYLAYVCLILGTGLVTLEETVSRIRRGEMQDFRQFITEIDDRQSDLPAALRSIHKEIYVNVQAGDPTPFKPFRYNEYHATLARMGGLPADAPLERFLKEEILLTREVRDLALAWKAQGTLVFGLSDKPDEASVPTPELVAQGFVPLHHKRMHILGA